MTLAALALALCAQTTAQESGVQIGEFRFDDFVSRQEGDEVIYIVDNLRFRSETTRLTGDYAVLWLDAARYARLFEGGGDSGKLHRGPIPPSSRGRILPAPPPSLLGSPGAKQDGEPYSLPTELVREIYIEGAVYFEQGEERLLQGAGLYMDLSSGRALISEGKLRTAKAGFHESSIPISVKARWFRREATGRFVADDAEYTTCSFGKPHQHIESDQIWIEDGPAGTAIDAYRSTFRFEGAPVFYLPRTLLDPETKDMIFLRGAQMGTSSAFGFFVYTRWGQRFHEIGQDFNEWALGERLPFKGDWEIRLDHRNKRGIGIGPELEWETPGVYRGRLRGYFTRDSGEDQSYYFNSIVQEEGERARIQFENRVWLDKEWTFDTELFYASDPAFLREFFRSDYLKDKEPETSAYLRWARDNQAFTALVKSPINEFDPVPAIGFLPPTGGPLFPAPAMKESLPELRHHWLREPLFALPLPAGTGDFSSLPLVVHYTEKTSAGYLRRHPSKGIEFEPATIGFLPAEDLASARFDTVHELSAPFRAEPFVLTPFLEERYTAYSADASGDETSRVVGAAGVRVTTHMEESWGDGWNHLVDPSISYENTYAVTRDPSALVSFDESETIRKNEVLVLALRNRLQRRAQPKAATSEKRPSRRRAESDWHYPFDLDLRLPIYLDPDRDNAGQRYGDLETDLYFETGIQSGPFRGLRGVAELASSVREPGPTLHRLNFAEAYLAADPTDNLGIFIRHRRYRDIPGGNLINTGLGGGFTYRINEKWMLIGFESYNFETRESESHGFTMRRIGHDWVFEITTTFEAATNEKIFAFNVQPLQLFRRGRQLGGLSGFLSSSLGGQDFYTE